MSELILVYSNDGALQELLDKKQNLNESIHETLHTLFHEGVVDSGWMFDELKDALLDLSKESEESFYIIHSGADHGIDFENAYGLNSYIYKFKNGTMRKGNVVIQMPDWVD